jgi:hypothetical protein
MAPRPNVTIVKSNGNLGRRAPTTDAVFGCVISAPAIAGAGNMQNGVVYPFNSINDAMAIGITAAYDTANTVLVYYRINRFFLRNPNATLYALFAPQTAALADMVDPLQAYAPTLLKSQNGAIKYCWIARNPVAGYTPVLSGGFDEDVLNAIPKAQALYTSEFASFRYAGFLIEGRSFNGTAGASTNLRALLDTNVSVTAAADPATSNLNAAFHGYAAVEDIAGIISLAAVSQDPGELNPAFNLQNTGLGMFVTAGLSSNLSINSYVDADLDQLNTNGIICPDVVAGYPGFYMNDSHTCGAIADNDYAYIENNRTIEKAIFLSRTAILPNVKSRVYVDPSSGELAPKACKAIETTGNRSLAGMQTDGDISGGIDTYVDPSQNLLATSQLIVQMTFVPVPIARQITINIGFSNPLNTAN